MFLDQETLWRQINDIGVAPERDIWDARGPTFEARGTIRIARARRQHARQHPAVDRSATGNRGFATRLHSPESGRRLRDRAYPLLPLESGRGVRILAFPAPVSRFETSASGCWAQPRRSVSRIISPSRILKSFSKIATFCILRRLALRTGFALQ